MVKIFNIFLICCLILGITVSCQKEPPKVLPTISTTAASNITSTSGMSGGNVTDDGGAPVTSRGICWDTNQNPSINDNKTSEGTGPGSFTSSLTGLLPGTTYYIRAYATNAVGTSYGSQISFTTNSVSPILTTLEILSFTSTTATSGGIITSDGGSPITVRGVCWKTSPNPTISDNKTSNGTGSGIFTSSLTNLLPGTTYYLRAYATNTNGTSYGNELSFSTSTTLPVLTTTIGSEITATSATSGGNITSDGGVTVTSRGVCWSTSQNPTIADNKTTNGDGVGGFVSTISNLLPNTTYYIRAYATNSAGTSYGNQISIKTLVTTPTVTTAVVSEISATTSVSGGNITNDGGQAITARGVCWSTNQNPTISSSKTTNGIGTGIYTSNLTGLIPGTKYYVRAYATNASGTSYGNQVEFISIYTTPIIATSGYSAVASTSARVTGDITHDGGKSIIARGICWSTSQNPTIYDSKTTNGASLGTFTASIAGLSPNITYYARAYAINSVGTEYGEQVSFKTPSTVTDIDGNIYNTVIIGNQVWFQENLRTTKYNDGASIFYMTLGGDWINNFQQKTPAFCWPNNDKATYAVPYGGLYNWYAVETSKLCPSGWHVSTDADWTNAVNLFGGYEVAGEKFKIEGTEFWASPNIASNETGFNAIPAGSRELGYYGGAFMGIGDNAYWWAYSTIGAWYRHVNNISKIIWRHSAETKWGGASIRCVKN